MRRRRKLGFESLESLSLLTAYPIGFVGPVELGSTFTPADQAGNPSGTPLSFSGANMPGMQNWDPDVAISSPSMNSIGGQVNVLVTATAGHHFKSVSYSSGGPASPIMSQTWTANESSFTQGVPGTHSWSGSPNNPYPDTDTANWYWGIAKGKYTVTVTVTYDDPQSTVKTVSKDVDVTDPTVDYVKVTGNADQFGPVPTQPGYVGTYYAGDGAQVMPIQYEARTSSSPSLGAHSFLQKCFTYYQIKTTYIDAQNRTHIVTTTVDAPDEGALDSDGSQIALANWEQAENNVGPHLTTISDDHAVGDSPKVFNRVSLNSPFPISFSIIQNFTTYLMWRPRGGINVAIGKVDWGRTATATYNGPLAPLGVVIGALNDNANWTFQTNHPVPAQWTETGGQFDTIPLWDANWATQRPNYTTITDVIQ